jgi:hypothetical protein
MSMRTSCPLLLSSVALLWILPSQARAQAAPVAPAPVANKRIFVAADFARFSPRTALDMLRQVPGFSIRKPDEERGLGQASENVLINGARINNKSGGAADELSRVPAGNVERIEIVEAASLGIAGLTGQVANVIVKAQKASSGQFEWNPTFRAHYAEPEWLGGSISYSGQSGPVEYNFSVNNNFGRGAFGGPIRILDANGVLTETRTEIYHSEFEQPKFQAKFGLDGPGSSVGNLTLMYGPYWNPTHIRDRRIRVGGDNRRRTTVDRLAGYQTEINADYEFAAGPGRLKFIGLRKFDHEPLVTRQVLSFDRGAPSTGTILDRNSRIGELIGRAEYKWKGGPNDWLVSLERAYNYLDQRGRLSELNPDGEFVEVPFPNGTGRVEEVRHEALGTLSRPLSTRLDLQVAAGGEISRLERVDGDLPARKFFRPKGSVSLAWRPAEGWDVSLKLRRRVGQISFYDFLDQPKLSVDRENAGNPDLVPPQSWELEGEVGREFGAWGKARIRVWTHRVQDIVDVIPIGDKGQGVGNLPRATRTGFETVDTLLFDPLGWKGAKLDVTVGMERTSVRDPLTGEKRPISGIQDRWATATLRHDIPNSPIAWGATAEYTHFTKYYYPTEVYRNWEGPWWIGFFVEHKNVFGLTVRADVANVMDARHIFNRRVYSGRRTEAPASFIEKHDQLIGPLFSLSVKGDF